MAVESTFSLQDLVAGLADTFGRQAWSHGAELVVDIAPPLSTGQGSWIGDLPALLQRLTALGEQVLQPSAPISTLVLGITQRPGPPENAGPVVLRFGFHDPGRVSAPAEGQHADVPLSRQPHGTAASLLQPLDAALRPLQQHHILAVDDNASALRVLLQVGDALGLSVEPAQDGWDALRAVMLAHDASRAHGLVLLDARMPGMDAVDCARQLRETTPCRAPIVLMAGPGDDDSVALLAPDQPLGQALGIRGVLRKPVTDGSLLARACLDALTGTRPAAEAAAPAPGPLAGLHLLVVSETAVRAAPLLRTVRQAGASARLATGTEDPLDAPGSPPCHAVLLDGPLPMGRSLEAARAIGAEPRLRHLPLVAIGEAPAPAERASLLAAGIAEQVGSPVDAQALADAFRRCAAARAVSATATSASLESLPGVDAAVGRASTMGNDKLYRRLLIKFRDAQRDVPGRIADAWKAGDQQSARRLAHDLASVSGTLGAMQLHATARRLESVCAGEADPQGLPAALTAASVELACVVSSLQSLGSE